MKNEDLKRENNLDSILEAICRYSITDKQMKDNVEFITYLRGLGYINAAKISSVNGSRVKLTPTDAGKEFFRNGGFKNQRKKKNREKIYKWVDLIHKLISIIALILSILAISSK